MDVGCKRQGVKLNFELKGLNVILLVNAEHYGRAGANPRVWEYTSFKKTQPYLVIQVNKKFHKFERVYRDCIKRTRDKTRIHCIPHDAPGT